MMDLYRACADVVVVVHTAYIAFVVFGLLAILPGGVLRWGWVRNFWFRAAHLLAIAIVAVQSLLGLYCPLTLLEDYLRKRAGEAGYSGSFIEYWTHQIIFYTGPRWVFQVGYCLFFVAVVAAMVWAPPRWPGKRNVKQVAGD